MRHIADGALHAYLDGAHDQIGGPGEVEALEAHLAECAACRARLEAEREVGVRASEILAMGAPRATELPPFAALEGRRQPARAGEGAAAARGTPARRPYPLRRTPLAWVATVLLALGAGWTARELLETPGDDRLIAVTAGEPEAERSPGARTRFGAVPPPEPRRTGAPVPGVPGSQDAAAPAGGMPAAPADAREGQALAAATDPRPPRDRAEEGAEPTEAAEHPAIAIPAAPPPPAAEDASRAMALRSAPREELRLRRDPEAVAAERERERQPVPLGEPAAAAASDRVWRPMDRSLAEATLGRPILSVPDLPVIAVEELATEAGRTIRVRQRLATGEVLTLRQSLVEPASHRGEPAAAAAPARTAESEHLSVPSAARPAPVEVEAREERDGSLVEMREGDLVIHARAPIPLDRLRALLVRLR